MQGINGLVTFGPYNDLQSCRVAGQRYLAKVDDFKWRAAACYSSGGKFAVIKKANNAAKRY